MPRRHLRLVPALLAAAAGFSSGGPLAAQDFSPQVLGTVPEGIQLFSPPGAATPGYSKMVFSPDGRRYAFVGYLDGRTVPVVDGEVGEPWHFLSGPAFSGDSEHIVFRAGQRVSDKQEAWIALRDGEKSKATGWLSDIAIGPDGTLAFWEQPKASIRSDGTYGDSQAYLRFGRARSRGYPSGLIATHRAPVIVAEGRIAAAVVHDGASAKVLLLRSNGKSQLVPKEAHPLINDFAVSDDGRRVACAVSQMPAGLDPAQLPPGMNDTRQTVVCDRETFGAGFDGAGGPVFSPKGKVLAFKVLEGDRMGIATEHQKPDGPTAVRAAYAFVSRPVFSPKGDRLAFAAYEGPPMEPTLRLSPLGDDSPVLDSTARLVVRDRDKPGEPTGEAWERIQHITFAPKGDAVAFAGQRDGSWWVVCGERKAGPYRQVGPPCFDRKGEQVAFGALRDRKILWEVLE